MHGGEWKATRECAAWFCMFEHAKSTITCGLRSVIVLQIGNVNNLYIYTPEYNCALDFNLLKHSELLLPLRRAAQPRRSNIISAELRFNLVESLVAPFPTAVAYPPHHRFTQPLSQHPPAPPFDLPPFMHCVIS